MDRMNEMSECSVSMRDSVGGWERVRSDDEEGEKEKKGKVRKRRVFSAVILHALGAGSLALGLISGALASLSGFT